MITIYSSKEGIPSYTLEYLPDRNVRVLVNVDTKSHGYFYEDNDGDGIFDSGLSVNKETNETQKFLIETRIIPLEGKEKGRSNTL